MHHHFVFKRKIFEVMAEWKEKHSSSMALVIKGLRQVGKTTAVLKFAEDNYQNVVYVDFKTNKNMTSSFDGNLDVDTIVLSLSSKLTDAKFIPGKTVIVFDEIQECPNARESLKSFVNDGRYSVIATGSLLGIRGYSDMAGKVSVGYEEPVYMRSMDFEEFLWAKGVPEKVTDYLRDCFFHEKPVEKAIQLTMQEYFRQYICIGGMPSVVQTYLDTGSMGEVLAKQRSILNNYDDDFGKHLNNDGKSVTDSTLLSRIREALGSMPSQLSRDNKKFKYAAVRNGGRKSMYEAAIDWLCDYGLAVKCFRLNSMERPLSGNCDPDTFKLYFRDTGLFVAMLDDGTSSDILEGNLGIYKGAIYENIIADAFSKAGRPLYYYEKNGRMEIDFVTTISRKVTLIEVKSVTGHAKSVKMVLSNPVYGIDSCIKLGEYNIGRSKGILTLPHYMAYLVNELDRPFDLGPQATKEQ